METLHLSRLTVSLLEVETPGYPHSSRRAVSLPGVEAWLCGVPLGNVVDDFRLHNLKVLTSRSPLVRDTIFLAELRVARSK